MKKIKKWFRKEFINGQTKTDWTFLIFGIVLQIAAIIYGYATGTPDNLASIISAITGVASVVLCAQKKISFYVFGYIQLLTYVFGVAIPNHLYGEIYENIFYFVTMVIGMIIWFKNYKVKENGAAEVKAKKLNARQNIITYSGMVILTLILWVILKNTNDPVPFFDSVTTIPAFIAQILLMLGYRDQWSGWFIEDVTSLIMFIILGNWVMVAQYVFWSINCMYGWYKWSRED